MAYKTYSYSDQGDKPNSPLITQSCRLGEQADNDQGAYQGADELCDKLFYHPGVVAFGKGVYKRRRFSLLLILVRKRQVINSGFRRICS